MDKRHFFDWNISQHKVLLWFIAFIITISSAVYQRTTGPTYPARGHVLLDNTQISFKLLRSETVDKNAAIKLQVPDTSVIGFLKYKRYKSYDEWFQVPLSRKGDQLVGYLPRLPAAGKIMYYVYLRKGKQKISLTGNEPVVLRYKGAVPLAILLPHVIIMFLAMLFSTRTALEALDSKGSQKKYMLWTIGLFFMGGFILGPVVQKYAFDALWTGVPFGWDLTDNKTLIAMLGWLWAWFLNRKQESHRGWIIFAAVLMLAVYLIPHSVFGSEIDFKEVAPSQDPSGF
jgi:hypothetical protein